MNSETLFAELIHRLRHYADAMLLFGMLKEHADVREFESTRPKISRRQLENAVDRFDISRSLDRLQTRGLITVRTHANTRTHIAVNRQAVLDLLAEPLSPRLPGRHEFKFPFLEAWNADIAARHEAAAAVSNADAADAEPFSDPSPESGMSPSAVS